MMRFDRYTERAQDATMRAYQILQRYNHNQVDVEHLRPVVAERGCRNGRTFGNVIEVASGELRERFVGARRGERDRVDEREPCNGQDFVHDHPRCGSPDQRWLSRAISSSMTSGTAS